jgi:hypothetical protein
MIAEKLVIARRSETTLLVYRQLFSLSGVTHLGPEPTTLIECVPDHNLSTDPILCRFAKERGDSPASMKVNDELTLVTYTRRPGIGVAPDGVLHPVIFIDVAKWKLGWD